MKNSQGSEMKVIVVGAVVFVVAAFGFIMWCRHLLYTAVRP
jgi:hypothetical protein